MEYARAGRLLGGQAKAYFADVVPLARDTVRATLTASHHLARLLLVLTRPLLHLLLHLYRALSPAMRHVLRRAWAAFCLQPARVLAIEAGAGLAAMLLSLLERRFGMLRRLHALSVGSVRAVRRRYRALLADVRAKSKTAAMALPHALFIAAALGVHAAVGQMLAPFTQGAGMVFFACVRPAVRTVLLLYSVDVDEEGEEELEVEGEATPVEGSLGRGRKGWAGTGSVMSSEMGSVESTESVGERVKRRRRGRRDAMDSLRSRAVGVAAEIENEGDEAEMSRVTPSRVRIDDMAVVREAASKEEAVPGMEVSFFRTPELSLRGRRRTAFTEADEGAARESMEVVVLRFWVVFGLVWGLRSLAWYFCPGVLVRVVQGMDTALFYFFLWAQLGMTAGASVVYATVRAIARRRRWRWAGRGREREVAGQIRQLGVLMRLAVAANLISAERAPDFTENVAESGLALVGLVFLVTPRVATYVGTLLIGLMVPCYFSTWALEGSGGSGVSRHNWLSYWSVFSLMDAGFLAFSDMFGWLPLWYHAKMVMILWLQLPYYRGSVAILDAVMGYVGSALSSVRKQVVTPRKRKRA